MNVRQDARQRGVMLTLQVLSGISFLAALIVEFGLDEPYVALVPFTIGIILQERFWRLRRSCAVQETSPAASEGSTNTEDENPGRDGDPGGPE